MPLARRVRTSLDQDFLPKFHKSNSTRSDGESIELREPYVWGGRGRAATTLPRTLQIPKLPPEPTPPASLFQVLAPFNAAENGPEYVDLRRADLVIAKRAQTRLGDVSA